jgi:N,N-dimethylformamidase beta subunit-like protein
MVHFLEREGYDVTYATSLDMERTPGILDKHTMFLSAFHDEYWSWSMRDTLDGPGARASTSPSSPRTTSIGRSGGPRRRRERPTAR